VLLAVHLTTFYNLQTRASRSPQYADSNSSFQTIGLAVLSDQFASVSFRLLYCGASPWHVVLFQFGRWLGARYILNSAVDTFQQDEIVCFALKPCVSLQPIKR